MTSALAMVIRCIAIQDRTQCAGLTLRPCDGCGTPTRWPVMVGQKRTRCGLCRMRRELGGLVLAVTGAPAAPKGDAA